MGRIGVSIVKRCNFRGSTQEFSNHYFYNGPDTMPDNAAAGAIIDEIVVTEKALHSNAVSFIMGRLWSAGGTPAQNVMILEKPLAGIGGGALITGFDPERAVLVRWPAGIDIRGRPVYLRKWYHSFGNCAGVIFQAGMLDQSAQIGAANKTTIQNKVAENGVVGATSQWSLCAPNGRNFDGNQPQCHDYLEHHQFGEQWRG